MCSRIKPCKLNKKEKSSAPFFLPLVPHSNIPLLKKTKNCGILQKEVKAGNERIRNYEYAAMVASLDENVGAYWML